MLDLVKLNQRVGAAATREVVEHFCLLVCAQVVRADEKIIVILIIAVPPKNLMFPFDVFHQFVDGLKHPGLVCGHEQIDALHEIPLLHHRTNQPQIESGLLIALHVEVGRAQVVKHLEILNGMAQVVLFYEDMRQGPNGALKVLHRLGIATLQIALTSPVKVVGEVLVLGVGNQLQQ